MRDWVVADLGPTMEAAGYGDVQIMVLDHNRDALPWYPQTVRILNNKHILLMEHARFFCMLLYQSVKTKVKIEIS